MYEIACDILAIIVALKMIFVLTIPTHAVNYTKSWNSNIKYRLSGTLNSVWSVLYISSALRNATSENIDRRLSSNDKTRNVN